MAADVLLISGAAGGLGSGLVRRAADEGWRLILTDRNQERLAALTADIDPDQHVAAPCDALNRNDLEALIERGSERFGSLDAVVHTVGGFAMGDPVHASDDDTWERMMTLNLKTCRVLSEAVVPVLQRGGGGRIAFITARAALEGAATMGPYCASKAALRSMIESMAKELAEDRITVNGVLPSMIDTPMNRKNMPDADPARWVTPDSLAGVLLFLVSEDARDISGASIPVYGRS